MFDFPNSPAVGDIFTDPTTGATWRWSGEAWRKAYSEPPAGVAHPPAETIPLEPPIDGETTVQGSLQKLSLEVDAVAAETGNKVDVAGDTMTGPLILSEHPTAASPEFQAATKGFISSVTLPPGGTPGQALVKDPTNIPVWGASIDGANF